MPLPIYIFTMVCLAIVCGLMFGLAAVSMRIGFIAIGVCIAIFGIMTILAMIVIHLEMRHEDLRKL